MLTHAALDLIEQMEQMTIIDAHEHLGPEIGRVEHDVDVFTLFAHYTRTDLLTAGMTWQEYDQLLRLRDKELSLDERWAIFRPFLDEIRHGSYARPAFIAAKEFYGCDDINDDTYRVISERMTEFNTPGIYDRVLRERCKIRCCLTQCGRADLDGDLLRPLLHFDAFTCITEREQLDKLSEQTGVRVRTLDDYLELMRVGINQWRKQGVAGIKGCAFPWPAPDRKKARKALARLLDGKTLQPKHRKAFESFVLDEVFRVARDLDTVVAIHSGVWRDFRELDAKHCIPWFQRHPDTTFDLYHLSIPSVRDALLIGKNFPNVWLNLCWAHIVSPQMTTSAMNEMLDLVPVNKILGFGGDYGLPVEKVLGHLMMARENIATVLAMRIDAGRMSRDEALVICRKWLWDNPKKLYKLDV